MGNSVIITIFILTITLILICKVVYLGNHLYLYFI